MLSLPLPLPLLYLSTHSLAHPELTACYCVIAHFHSPYIHDPNVQWLISPCLQLVHVPYIQDPTTYCVVAHFHSPSIQDPNMQWLVSPCPQLVHVPYIQDLTA
jgi:hypothetical protein